MQTRDRRFGTFSCGDSSLGCSVPRCKQPSNGYVAQGHSKQPAGEFGLSIFTQSHKFVLDIKVAAIYIQWNLGVKMPSRDQRSSFNSVVVLILVSKHLVIQ